METAAAPASLASVLAYLREADLAGVAALLLFELEARSALAEPVPEASSACSSPQCSSPEVEEEASASASATEEEEREEASAAELSALARNLALARTLASRPQPEGGETDEERVQAELVARYYNEREAGEAEALEFAAVAPPGAATSAPVACPPPSLSVLELDGAFAGPAFTFSPTSAPSPPISLTGFSWRSATDEEEETEEGSPSGDDMLARFRSASASQLLSPASRQSSGELPELPAGEASPPSSPVAELVAAARAAAEAEEEARLHPPQAPPPPPLEVLELRVITQTGHTGFEEEKDFPIVLGSTVAGRYQVVEYLGSAAFSKAVQAHDLHTGALVCLKIIKNSKDFFDQSLDEIKLLKHLNAADPADEHGLLRLYDYFYHKEHLFIVTELLRANLYEFQKYNRESGEAPYFTQPRLQSIARQVLHSLAFMHSLGLLHCDLKPENILIKSYSRCLVKVIDVGSSCYITDHLSSYVQSRSYRAPEVILGLPYDYRIDLWSLGCILAELCTGVVLLQNDSIATLLARVVGMSGPLPARMLAGRYAHRYFTPEG